MSDYLQMPWSIEDTIENLEILKIAFQTKAIDIDLDGLGKQDAEEVAFGFDRAINALEENQQYRGLCKPEEIEHLKSLVRIIRHHGTIGMALEACAKYEEIGTPEECREAMEKQQAKKPTYDGDEYAPDGSFIWDEWLCPCCGSRFEVDYDNYYYCPDCGQKLDWSEEENDGEINNS